MIARVQPVILCGGSGTRLWPVSRESLPKQFVILGGKYSPFQETVLRVSDRERYLAPIIVAGEKHHSEIGRQLAILGVQATLLLEPKARDSGPAILAGCLLAIERRDKCVVAVLASDHLIENLDRFHESIAEGLPAAENGFIVTFGIRPDRPATGLGYIEPGECISGRVHQVQTFIEKPDAVTAASYIERGFLWNSGNFLTEPGTIAQEYARRHPGSYRAVLTSLSKARHLPDALVLEASHYAEALKTSIDYAIMETTDVAAVVPADWGWSDIGTWDAVWETSEKDADGNATIGETHNLNSSNCYVKTSGPLTSLVGVSDLVVIVEPDAVLVADRRNSGNVKTLVEGLRSAGHKQALSHERVQRSWGWYEVRDAGVDFKVKRLVVRPGCQLSLQKHRFRAEHWIIVTGTAQVTVDSCVRILRPNEHAVIPLGAVHRLENAGDSLLEIVEVQHGSYLGEDDIIRYEDIYYDRAVMAAE